MSNHKEDAEILHTYIEHGRSADGPNPDAAARRVVDALQQQAAQVSPDPHFVNQLSTRLQTAARQRPSPQSFADWLVLKMVPRLVWVGAAAAAVFLLVWAVPRLLQQQASPEPVVQQAEIIAGVVGDASFTLPESPANLPVYQIQLAPVPGSETAVLAWAREFGLTDPQLFVDPRRPENSAPIVRGGDGQTLTFAPPAQGGIQYQAQPYEAETGAPLPFSEAANIAQEFLRQHGLDGQIGTAVTEHEAQRPYADYPVRYVQVSPATGNYPLVADWLAPGAVIAVSPDGQVRRASFFPAAIQSQSTADVIPAGEVYDAFVSGELQPFRLNTQSLDATVENLPYQVFSPPPAEHTPGDEVQVFGWVDALMTADGRQKTATLYDGPRDTVYELAGPQLEAFFAALSDAPLVTSYAVQGTITAQTGDQTWQLAIAAWEPGEPVTSSLSFYTCQIGVFSREGSEAWFVSEADNGRYPLPDAPSELPDGDRIEVCAPEFPPTEAPIRWESITLPPASEAAVGPAAGLSSISSVQTAVIPEGAAGDDGLLPTPVPLPDSSYPGASSPYPAPAGSYPAPAPGYPSMTTVEGVPVSDKVPFEIGATADITGVLDATYFAQPDGTRRLELVIILPDEVGLMGGGFPVIGEAAALNAAAEGYHGRFAHLTAQVVALPADTYGPDRTGYELIAVQPAWPEAAMQNYLGQISTAVIAGTDAVIFTDQATDQRYVIAWDDLRYFDADFAANQAQILVQGIVAPDKTLGGLPVMWVKGSSTGPDVEQAIDPGAFPSPLEPDVVELPPPFSGLEEPSQLIIERMELVYFFDPAYDQLPPGQSGQLPLAEEQLLKPVWAIYGRTADNEQSFTAYFNAVRE